MRNGFEILVWAIFPQMYLWIHDKYSSIRFKQCECREKYFNTINFDELLVQWWHGPLVRGRTFSLEEVGVLQLGSNPGVSSSICFFLSSFFYPLAFHCLFSLLTPLASRDFCENVFLVLCTKICSFHHIDASFFIVCPLTDHNIASWHCQSVVDPRARAPGKWMY